MEEAGSARKPLAWRPSTISGNKAFEELIVTYDRKLYNLVLRLVGDRDIASDITQEAFVRAFRAKGGFRGQSSPYTWLCRIAINLCKNQFRDRAKWDAELIEEDSEPSGEATPHEIIERAELAEKVRSAIDELPLGYRVVAVLRDIQGLSYQEVAEASGLSVDVVKTRLSRARGMLRRKLENYITR